MTEHDRRLVEEWQTSCEGVTERRLRDFTNALDDLRSLSSKRQGAHTLRANKQELKNAMRSLHDLYSLDNRGLPGVNIVTTELVGGVTAQSDSLGFEPAVVYVPHPIQNRTKEEIEALADAA